MVERPRLLVVASTYPRWKSDPEPGFVHELARRMTDRFDVCVLCPHAQGSLVREAMDGVTVIRYRYAPAALETLVNDGGVLTNLRHAPWKWLLVPWFLVGQYLALRRLVGRFAPQVVHAHWIVPQGVVAALALRATPWVVTSHGADLFGLRGAWFKWMRGWVTRRAAVVTLVSEAMREGLLSECPRVDARVMPMGVDVGERFVPGTQTRDEHELLFVGRLVEKKGLRHLIAALPAILSMHPAARLSIVGFGPEKERLEKQVRALGLVEQVRFLGALPQDALPSLYQRATLFVAPFVQAANGDQEGLGLVVAEAMACACPVVVGDIPAVHDLAVAGAAVVAPSTAPQELARTIGGLLADRAIRAELGEAGRRHVERHYAWEAVAQRYADLLLELAGSSNDQ